MRIKSDIVAVNSTSSRKVFRCKNYRNLSQLPSSGSCTTTSTYFYEDNIIEEEEEAMVETTPPDNSHDEQIIENIERLIPAALSTTAQSQNGLDLNCNEASEQEEEEEEEEENDDDGHIEEEENLPSTNDSRASFPTEPPEIKVTIDNSLQQMAHEYREKFDGFAELYCFETIEELHDFIKSTLEEYDLTVETPSNTQDRYIQLLLNEKPDNRFKRLLEINRATVRQILVKNVNILQELFSSANLENFPKAIISIDDDDDGYLNSRDIEVEENMKKWYMIELIGIWLKNITDVDGYRDAIKKKVLKKNWGIENDRYNGIVVPLNYK